MKMDALKFIEERNRMCDYYRGGNALSGCAECPAFENACSTSFRSVTAEYIEVVERWSQEHLRKTRQDVLLEQWPEAEISFTDGCLTLDPCKFHKNMRKECVGKMCSDCRREFWMQEAE